MVRVATLTFIFLVTAVLSFAQGDSARVSGRITDPSGGVIAGAECTITNIDTKVSSTTLTNQDGIYVLPSLRPGTYRLTVAKADFHEIVKTNIELHIQDADVENFVMAVGSSTEIITVNGGGIVLNTTDGTVSTLVDATTVANMPLNGRSFQDLILLTPGVVTNSPQLGLQAGAAEQGGFSVNGQRVDANYYTVDGVSANVSAPTASVLQTGSASSGSLGASTILGTTQALVSVDDLQEFRVQSSTYSAQYGRNPGGQLSFETKSGTNTWHGTAFDYYRDSGLGSADDWFYNYVACKPSELGCANQLHQNDFGGTLGGPVRIPGVYNGKDKTFFFVNYEGLRLTAPGREQNVYVPDLCLRGIAGTCTAADTAAGVSPSTNAAMLSVLNSFPYPNLESELLLSSPTPPGVTPPPPSPSGFGVAALAYTSNDYINSTSVRLDQVVTDKMTAFFRFSNTSSASSLDLYGSGDTVTQLTRTYTGGANNIFSSRLSNEFRLNYSSSAGITQELPGEYAYADTALDAGGVGGTAVPFNPSFAGLLGVSSLAGLKTLSVNFVSAGVPVNQLQLESLNQQTQWNVVDTLSYTAGAHLFKFGVDWRRTADFIAPTDSLSYEFATLATVESGQVGATETISIPGGPTLTEALSPAGGSVSSPLDPVYTNFSAFAQDTWKVTHRLTLDYGLRWELNPAPSVAQGNLPYTITGTNSSNYALLCANGVAEGSGACYSGAPLWATTWANFAPRLGAAYVLRNNPGWETVLRGGGGVFYDTGQQLGSISFNGPGFHSPPTSLTFLAGSFPGPTTSPFPPNCTPSTANPNCLTVQYPAVQNSTAALYGFAPHLQLPYTLQWNASVQQALGRSQSVTISYVGSHGARLLEELQVTNLAASHSTECTTSSPPVGCTLDPNGSSFFLAQNGLTSDYDALQLQYQHIFSHGLSALASYTWSHCIDYGSANFEIGYQRGNCDTDVRQNFSSSFSYSLPNVGGNGVLKAILDHWGVDDYFLARTGFPIFLQGLQMYDPTTGLEQSGNYDVVLGSNGQPLPQYLYGNNCVTQLRLDGELTGGTGANVCPGGRAINPCAFYLIPGLSGSGPMRVGASSGGYPTTACNTLYGVGTTPTLGGVAPRNQLRGFGAWQMNLAIRREFPIYQRLKLQFRAEAFNIFNHPNFGIVNTQAQGAVGGFGLVTQTLASSLQSGGNQNLLYQFGGPRSMQFALKLIF